MFSFTDQTDASINTVIISNPITVTGINAPASISISGADASYSINGRGYTNESGIVKNDDIVIIKVTSSSEYNTPVSVTLIIGGISSCLNVVTESGDSQTDRTPDPFNLIAQSDVVINTVITSNIITVSGINAPTTISISGSDGMYSINSDNDFTNAPGTINNGDTVMIRMTSSSNYNTAMSCVLSIGGITNSFNVTTLMGDSTPDPYAFSPQNNLAVTTVAMSNEIIVTGISVPTEISISGGNCAYSINGGILSNKPSIVNENDIVFVGVVSSSKYNTTVSTTLNIGGVTSIFSVTTAKIPDIEFNFQDQVGVRTRTAVFSNPMTITGISAPTPISILSGDYSVNGGEYTRSSGLVVIMNLIFPQNHELKVVQKHE